MKIVFWILTILMVTFFIASPFSDYESFWASVYYTTVVSIGLNASSRGADKLIKNASRAQLWCLWLLYVSAILFQSTINDVFAEHPEWYRYICGIIFVATTLIGIYRYGRKKY